MLEGTTQAEDRHGQLARGYAAIESTKASFPTSGPAAETAKNQEVVESMSDPEFSLAVEVLYHGSRVAFLTGAHRWAMFLTIIFGASAAVPFWGERMCALLAAATAAADIAFDFTGQAQVHADIKRRYFEMVGELSRASGGVLADFGARWMVISADEPPLYRNLSLIVERNVCISLGRVVPKPLPLWKRLLANLWRG